MNRKVVRYRKNSGAFFASYILIIFKAIIIKRFPSFITSLSVILVCKFKYEYIVCIYINYSSKCGWKKRQEKLGSAKIGILLGRSRLLVFSTSTAHFFPKAAPFSLLYVEANLKLAKWQHKSGGPLLAACFCWRLCICC